MWQFPLLSSMQLSIATQAFPSPVQPVLHLQVAVPGPVLVHRASRRRERKRITLSRRREGVQCKYSNKSPLSGCGEFLNDQFWFQHCRGGRRGWDGSIFSRKVLDNFTINWFQKHLVFSERQTLVSRVAQNSQRIPYHPVKLFHYRRNIPWRGGAQSPAWRRGMESMMESRSLSGKTSFVLSAILFPSIRRNVFLSMRGLNYGEVWLFGSHFHHKAPQFFTKDNNVVLMVTRNMSCGWQLSYSLNAATEKITHVGRAWGENHYKPKISTANLCSCQNIWCKPAKLSLGCHVLAPTQMTDILTMTVSRYLLLRPILQTGKVSTQNA